MKTRRIPGHLRSSAPAAAFESLEPRQLLATWFNPDGPTVSLPSQTPSSMVTADFDGDTKPDLVTAVGKDIFFQKGRGGGRFGPAQLITHLNTDAGLLAVGNFNGDTLPDLISVQKGVHQGWNRLLINTGNGQFFVGAYGRAWTAVESVTVGNIDSDAADEVLLKGSGPLVATLPNNIWGEAPDEIRVLDPEPVVTIFPATGQNILPPPFPLVRFTDRGPAIYGQKLGVPLIANLNGGPTNNIVLGGQDADPFTGFIQVYTYNEFTPVPGNSIGTQSVGLPPPLFNPVGDRIIVAGVVTSIVAADMTADSKTDLVVSTLEYPELVAIPFGFNAGDTYRARTFALPRFGPSDRLYFNSPSMIDDRVITTGDLLGRLAAPDYRIATVADLNSDGLMDVGISLTESLSRAVGDYLTTGSFIQAIRNPVEPIYLTSIVAQSTAAFSTIGGTDRVQLFLAADVRRVGRPDLFVAEQPTRLSTPRITIRFNVNAPALQPWEGTIA